MIPLTRRERQLAALRGANEARKAAAGALRAENPRAYTASGRRSRARFDPKTRSEIRRRNLLQNTGRGISDIMSYDIDEYVPTRRNRMVSSSVLGPHQQIKYHGVNTWNITPMSFGFDENMVDILATYGNILRGRISYLPRDMKFKT